MSIDEKNSRYINQSIKRAMSIINLFDSRRTKLSATEIANELDTTPSSIYPILYTLKEFGYIHQDGNKKYSLGLIFLEKSNLILDSIDLRTTAKPFLKAMARTLQGNAHLALLYENDVMYLEREEGHLNVSITNIVGQKVPAYCTALGKVLLANSSEPELDNYLGEVTLEPFTPNTITDEEELRGELDQTASRGYAIDNEEFQSGSICVAAPIRDYTGATISAISISLSRSDYPDLDLEEPIEEVTETAGKISQELGGTLTFNRRPYSKASQ